MNEVNDLNVGDQLMFRMPYIGDTDIPVGTVLRVVEDEGDENGDRRFQAVIEEMPEPTAELDLDDDMTTAEIDDVVRDWMFENIEWGWERE